MSSCFGRKRGGKDKAKWQIHFLIDLVMKKLLLFSPLWKISPWKFCIAVYTLYQKKKRQCPGIYSSNSSFFSFLSVLNLHRGHPIPMKKQDKANKKKTIYLNNFWDSTFCSSVMGIWVEKWEDIPLLRNPRPASGVLGAYLVLKIKIFFSIRGRKKKQTMPPGISLNRPHVSVLSLLAARPAAECLFAVKMTTDIKEQLHNMTKYP